MNLLQVYPKKSIFPDSIASVEDKNRAIREKEPVCPGKDINLDSKAGSVLTLEQEFKSMVFLKDPVHAPFP